MNFLLFKIILTPILELGTNLEFPSSYHNSIGSSWWCNLNQEKIRLREIKQFKPHMHKAWALNIPKVKSKNCKNIYIYILFWQMLAHDIHTCCLILFLFSNIWIFWMILISSTYLCVKSNMVVLKIRVKH